MSVRAANCSMNVVLCNFCQSLSIVESDICCIVLHGTCMCLIRALIFPLRNLIEILLFKAVTLVVTLHINGDDFMQSSILNA